MLELFDRMPNESAKVYAYRILTYNIVNINLKPGEKLNETELCKELNMSRTPVREAILDLTEKKLVLTYPQRGTYVAYIDPQLVEEVRYLRYSLESSLSALACDMITKEKLESLNEIVVLQRYYNGKNAKKLLELDKKFHRGIYEICNKLYLYNFVESISPHFDRTRYLSFECQTPMIVIEDHEQLLEAIEKRDKVSAANIAMHHLERSLTDAPLLKKHYPNYFNI